VGLIVLHHISDMSSSDLPSRAPSTTGQQPSMAAVHSERNKRKAAEARALAAEQTVAGLTRRIEELERINQETLAKLHLAQVKPPRSLSMTKGDLRFYSDGAISGTPRVDASPSYSLTVPS
jgi:hypothetical protein